MKMLVLNPRMVEGTPLHYYNYYQPPPVVPAEPYSYFNRFEPYRMADLSEEMLRANSPHSDQSDSDNSLSSVEIRTPKNEVKCCWRSCGITFATLDQLSTHVTRVHASSGPGGLFYCGWDGCTRNNKGFNARYKMLVHVRTHTNEKPHKCSQCDKSFSRAENLKIHSRSHSGEKPYICPIPGCNKAYSNSSDRFKHTRTHQVEKPYQCKVPGCPKRYTDPSSLRKHVKTYKHFVNENKTDLNNDIKIEPAKTYHNCTCPYQCCSSKAANKTDLLRLSTSWNKLYVPFTEKIKDDPIDMDVDLPLDLSVRRTHI